MSHRRYTAQQPVGTFELGADDRHVPPDGALRFEAVLRALYPTCGDAPRLTLRKGAAREVTLEMWRHCLEWWIR